jgi:hypothetical protein
MHTLLSTDNSKAESASDLLPQVRGVAARLELLRAHYERARERAHSTCDWEEEQGWYREVIWSIRQATQANTEFCKLLHRVGRSVRCEI